MIFLPIAVVLGVIFYFILQVRPFQYSKLQAVMLSGSSLIIVIVTKLFLELYPWYVAMPVAAVLLLLGSLYLQQRFEQSEDAQHEEEADEAENLSVQTAVTAAPKSVRMDQEEIDRLLGFSKESTDTSSENDHSNELDDVSFLASQQQEQLRNKSDEVIFAESEEEDQDSSEPLILSDLDIDTKEEQLIEPSPSSADYEIELEELGWDLAEEETVQEESPNPSPIESMVLYELGESDEEPVDEPQEKTTPEVVEVEDDFLDKRLQANETIQDINDAEELSSNDNKRKSVLEQLEHDLF